MPLQQFFVEREMFLSVFFLLFKFDTWPSVEATESFTRLLQSASQPTPDDAKKQKSDVLLLQL